MCTAATYKTKDFYFGRTLDHDISYGEKVVITPRNYIFSFLHLPRMENHYSIIGMACLAGDIPLYYDAVNEKGLCIAGLNFVGNACYKNFDSGKDNVAQFEFIPWILGQCADVEQAVSQIKKINITDESFSREMPAAQLHWLISDGGRTVTVEAVGSGVQIYENPAGVLTNNPPFEEQMSRLRDYMGLSPRDPENRFSKKIGLEVYSKGMGAIGLPGDYSSSSRFVRAAFVRSNSVSGNDEKSSVGQFFHILGSVSQPRGCNEISSGGYETTVYTSCCNASRGIYYYTLYGNRQITAVDMSREDVSGSSLIVYDLVTEEQINFQN